MGSRAETLAHVLDLLDAFPLTHRKMMGEYVLYLDQKVVAVIGDDRLWLKATSGGLAALPDCPRAAPFPGAKDWIDADSALDDPDRLGAALRAIAADLPTPKQKKRKAQFKSSFSSPNIPRGSGGVKPPAATRGTTDDLDHHAR